MLRGCAHCAARPAGPPRPPPIRCCAPLPPSLPPAEGRNREVRNLVEAAGLEVKTLRRVRIGGYRLPRGTAFGQFVELRPQEVRRVLDRGADVMV